MSDNEIKANRRERREYIREYNARPEVKDRKREYENSPENKARRLICRNNPETKSKKREYLKEYWQRPEIKANRKEYDKKNKDISFTQIDYIINCPICSKPGKIMEANTYNKITENKYKTRYIISHSSPNILCHISNIEELYNEPNNKIEVFNIK